MKYLVEEVDGKNWISFEGWSFCLGNTGRNRIKQKRQNQSGNGDIESPMPGQLLKLLVSKGKSIEEGETLCIVEAMKMEHSLKAPFAGEVEEVFFKETDSLSQGDVILKIKKDEAAQDA